MGSDQQGDIGGRRRRIFQSTLPAWGVTQIIRQTVQHGLFQSTLPAWGVTRFPAAPLQNAFISIHTPRMGSDAL